jgi:hypothetical protein
MPRNKFALRLLWTASMLTAALCAQPPAPAPAPAPAPENPPQLPWEARAILGWHQAGASASDSAQNLFFDFFVERPFGNGPVYASPFSLWGNVRIASAPQQRNIPVSQFAADFVNQLGSVPVNELAQSGEFVSGFEIRPKKLLWVDTDRARTLGFVAFFGANGAFQDPTGASRVFKAVPDTSPQFANFVANFPEFKDPGFRQRAQYVGLVPPDRERFFRQYGAGIRYTTYSLAKNYVPPAMFTATIGQDQMITRGRYVGPVFKADAFYPLPFTVSGKDISFIYLFGTVNMAIAKPDTKTPLAMQLVSGACGNPLPAGTTAGVDCGVNISGNNVAVYAIPSSRDTYRIGVGIDLVALLKSWITPPPASH